MAFEMQRATTRLGVSARTLSHDSTSAVNAIDESRAGSSVLADAGAAQSDAEDPIDDDVQSAGSFSPLLDSPRVDLIARCAIIPLLRAHFGSVAPDPLLGRMHPRNSPAHAGSPYMDRRLAHRHMRFGRPI